MTRFGDRATFAVAVGDRVSRDLRTVDLWAGGRLLTTDDNAAFVPAFARWLPWTASQVRRRDVRRRPRVCGGVGGAELHRRERSEP